METIVVAELEKYWITFEQLLQRWNIKDNLLASYCVCIDTSKGNCPLTPHFYQGEFLVPGGRVWKKFAIYEPRYKNTAEYINKNKTEYQLVQEFLDSITGIRRDEIWFPISSVEELEENDYSLAAAAQNYIKENSRYAEKAFTYTILNSPITFKEIFSLWVGKDKAEKVFNQNKSYICNDDDLNLIRSVENQIITSVYNNELKTYHKREASGRILFYETKINLALPLASADDGIDANLIFMFHNPIYTTIQSNPVYFESSEVFQKFSFLNQQSTNTKEQKNISSKSSTVFVYEIEDVLKEVFEWHLAEPKNLALYVGLLRLQRKKNEETYRIAWECYGENIPKDFGRSVRHQWERFLEYAEQKGMDREMLNNMIS